jgi:hypothetical protein
VSPIARAVDFTEALGERRPMRRARRLAVVITPPSSQRRYTSGSEYFPGLIDEVPIYNIALTEAQVQKHFNAGAR